MKQLCTLLSLFFIALPAWCARTVTDDLGRVVVVPDHPHRLVCLMPSVVDDVYALGAGADVVAVTDYTKYPAEARTKTSVGSIESPSMETIVLLHPDLVLESSEMSRPETVEALKKLDIPVFEIAPHGVEGIYQSILSLGRALNRDDAAKTLVASLRNRELAVRRQVGGKPVMSVLLPVSYNPILTIGKHAFITDLIEIAGGHSITADLAQEWPQVSLETVLARAPDALLLIRGSRMSIDKIRGQPGWETLPAVKNNRVYYVDDRIDLPSPVAFDALEELAKQFHP
ncbi:MAG TPA: cobalamin-binding protein [Terracidiphilus sp.]|nr:cobalamin-binding protein [Terracidiphilus sp.]